jgi:malate dehydrogenase
MNEVAILGAGEVGGLLAHVMMRRNLAHVRLIDDNVRAAEGRALDILQAGAIEGSATTIEATADVSAAAGASVVCIADPIGGQERRSDETLLLIGQIRRFSPAATILCTGASHREAVERGVRELHDSRARLLGSAPEAIASAARAIVALETNSAPSDVALAVLGTPPDHLVLVWEDATVGGFALTKVVGEPARRRIESRIRSLWPPGPYALASAAARIVESLLGRSRRAFTCFIAADDQSGTRRRAAAYPVRLGPSNLVEVVLPTLSGREQVMLDNATML